MPIGHSYTRAYDDRAEALSVRSFYVSTLCPVVLCPYLCTSDCTTTHYDILLYTYYNTYYISLSIYIYNTIILNTCYTILVHFSGTSAWTRSSATTPPTRGDISPLVILFLMIVISLYIHTTIQCVRI